jgi:hypothetical protein
MLEMWETIDAPSIIREVKSDYGSATPIASAYGRRCNICFSGFRAWVLEVEHGESRQGLV